MALIRAWAPFRRPRSRPARPDLHLLGLEGSTESDGDFDRAQNPDDSGRGSACGPQADQLDALHDAFVEDWRRGRMPRAEDYLQRASECGPDGPPALIYQEFYLAESSGLAPSPEEYLERFPEYRDRLERLFALHEAFTSSFPRPRARAELPRVGNEVGPYRLVRELGRGAFAVVFLAEQSDLEDRLVVVKVSTRPSPEPGLLGRARHPNIVEVLNRAETADGAFHLVCMPFLGGATLAAVLAEGRRRWRRPRSGRNLLDDLDAVAAREYIAPGSSRPARELLASLSHAKSVAWIVARLAEALDHACSRGITHGDLKPSNVLLAADGQPMLFDFNLALDWSRPGERDAILDSGGTLTYMAPERIDAFTGVASPTWDRAEPLRHRADIYSLGLILLEALTGFSRKEPAVAPGEGGPATSGVDRGEEHLSRGDRDLEAIRRAPLGLRPILNRCLAVDPTNRYMRARELAEDLDRYRRDLPLAFADPPPWPVGLSHWCRRQRRALAMAGLVLLAGGLAALGMYWGDRPTKEGLALAKLDALWNGDEPSIFTIRREGFLHDEAPPEVQAQQAQKVLNYYNVLDKGDWRARDDVRYLPERERADLEIWVMQQAWRLAHAWSQHSNWSTSWNKALAYLEHATGPAIPAPLEALARELNEKLGRVSPLKTAPYEPWVDESLAGFVAEAQHEPREALRHYNDALAVRPASFWGHYRASVVASEIGDYAASARHIEQCIAQRPNNARLRIALAGVQYHLGELHLAFDQVSRASDLAPELADVARSRAFIKAQMGQRVGLQNDIAAYVANERDASPRVLLGHLHDIDWLVGIGKGQFGADGDRWAAAFQMSNLDNVDAQILTACLLRDLGRNDEAIQLFESVLLSGQLSIWGRYARAMLLRSDGRPNAIAAMRELVRDSDFDQVIDGSGQALSVYRLLASDLILADQKEEAVAIACLGLDQARRVSSKTNGNSSPRDSFNLGQSHYVLARALVNMGPTNRAVVDRARDHLAQALALAPNEVQAWLRNDSLFNGFLPGDWDDPN